MIHKEAEMIESRVKDAINSGVINNDIINMLRQYLLDDDGQINADECSYLINNSALTLSYKASYKATGKILCIGVVYNNIGIEFLQIDDNRGEHYERRRIQRNGKGNRCYRCK